MLKVIFVGGAVLTQSAKELTISRIANRFGIKRYEFSKVFDDLSPDAMTGRLSEDTFWRELANSLDAKDQKNFKKYSLKAYRVCARFIGVDTGLVKIIKELKSHGYSVVLITNTIPSIFRIRAQLGLNKYFDRIFPSFKIGMAKPDPAVYDYCMKQMKVKPEECIFIGGTSESAASAERLGIKTIIFKSNKQLATRLNNYFKV